MSTQKPGARIGNRAILDGEDFTMMNRRRFLTTGIVGAGLAGVPVLAAPSRAKPEEAAFSINSFDEGWARANVEHLGVPRSWWHVHHGLHPFAPERVLVIENRPSAWQHRALKDRLLERGFGKDEYFSEEKLDYAICIMHVLARRYGVPEYFEDWATRLAAREDLGTALGYCHHCGLVHQFQKRVDQPVRTQNGLVDWWLFLIPGGVDFQSFDSLPTHILLGCVDTDGSVGRELYCMCHIEGLVRNLTDAKAVSQMDRLRAARHLNQRLLELMQSWAQLE
jgi:hypothetical protein